MDQRGKMYVPIKSKAPTASIHLDFLFITNQSIHVRKAGDLGPPAFRFYYFS